MLPQDLSAVLIDELGEEGDRLIGFLGTRFHLRLAMLEHPLRLGPDAELRWVIAESDSLRIFRGETRPDVREQMIDETRRWVMRDLRRGRAAGTLDQRGAMGDLFERFDESTIEQWDQATWEAFTLHALWRVCHAGVHGVRRFAAEPPPPVRQRDLLLDVSGVDTDRLVN